MSKSSYTLLLAATIDDQFAASLLTALQTHGGFGILRATSVAQATNWSENTWIDIVVAAVLFKGQQPPHGLHLTDVFYDDGIPLVYFVESGHEDAIHDILVEGEPFADAVLKSTDDPAWCVQQLIQILQSRDQ